MCDSHESNKQILNLNKHDWGIISQRSGRELVKWDLQSNQDYYYWGGGIERNLGESWVASVGLWVPSSAIILSLAGKVRVSDMFVYLPWWLLTCRTVMVVRMEQHAWRALWRIFQSCCRDCWKEKEVSLDLQLASRLSICFLVAMGGKLLGSRKSC
jgi:hypothetical protein